MVIGASGCKTTNSGTQDALTDEQRATLPPGVAFQSVPPDGIEHWVGINKGANGVPHSLDGLWWTDAKTIQYVISFKNTVWDSATRTAYILVPGFQTFSYSTERMQLSATPHKEDLSTLSGYDVVFAEDFKSAVLYVGTTIGGDHYRGPDHGLSMSWESDGVWVRHTKDKPDYRLRRIVKVDGTREPAYKDYLNAFGKSALVSVQADELKFTDPTAAISLNLQPGQPETYLTLPNSDDRRDGAITYFRLTADADFPVSLQATSGGFFSSDNDGRTLLTGVAASHDSEESASDNNQVIIVKAKGSRGGKARFSLQKLDPPHVSLSAPATLAMKAGESLVVQVDQERGSLVQIFAPANADLIDSRVGRGASLVIPAGSSSAVAYTSDRAIFQVAAKRDGNAVVKLATMAPDAFSMKDQDVVLAPGIIAGELASPLSANVYRAPMSAYFDVTVRATKGACCLSLTSSLLSFPDAASLFRSGLTRSLTTEVVFALNTLAVLYNGPLTVDPASLAYELVIAKK